MVQVMVVVVVGGGGGMCDGLMERLSQGFDMLQFFEKNLTFSGKPLIFSTRSLRHILENP